MAIEVVTPHPAKGVLAMRRITNRSLGEKYGFSSAFIGRCLNGRARPTPRLRQAIAAEVGLPESELFHDAAVQEAAQRLVESAVAAGFPRTVDDPDTLRRVASAIKAAS